MTTDIIAIEAVDYTQAMLAKGEEVVASSPQEQESWLLNAGDLLRRWDDVLDVSTMAEASVLYQVWHLWEGEQDASKRLHPSVTSKWDNDFYKWAATYTKKRAQREPARETIANKIAVFRDWVGERNIPYPTHVFIPKRDTYGNVLGTLEEDQDWQEIDFDPGKCDYGKLLVCRGPARRGMLNEDAWTLLADPYATVQELKNAIHSKVEVIEDGDETVITVARPSSDDFKFFESNGLLYASSNGVVKAFARLLTENSESPLVQKAFGQVLHSIGVKYAGALHDNGETQMPLAQVVEGHLLIAKGSEKVGQFDKEEAKEIKRVLDEMLEDF